MTKSNSAMFLLHEKGYKVTDNGDVINPNGRELRPRLDTRGYLTLNVRPNGIKASVGVHRLAAYQKYGAALLRSNVVVRHLNGDPTDNRLCNVAIGSPSDNMLDRDPLIRLAHSKVASLHNTKFSDHQITQIREDRTRGLTYKQLMYKHRISKTHVSYVVRGLTRI